jgi:hypothetical protein
MPMIDHVASLHLRIHKLRVSVKITCCPSLSTHTLSIFLWPQLLPLQAQSLCVDSPIMLYTFHRSFGLSRCVLVDIGEALINRCLHPFQRCRHIPCGLCLLAPNGASLRGGRGRRINIDEDGLE